MATPLEMANDQKATNMTLNRVRKHIAGYKNKKTIEEKIKPNITQSLGPRYTVKNKLPHRSTILHRYEQLLNTKVTDNEVQKDVIKFAELIVQNRAYCELNLHNNEGVVAQLVVVRCLPDHEQAFANYWLGRNIESNNFNQLVSQFTSKMKQYNIANTIVKQSYRGSPTKITAITTNMVYT